MKSKSDATSPWMLPNEVCDYLRLSRKALYEMTHKRTIPHIKIGNRLRFNRHDIDQWLAGRLVRANQQS